MMRAMDTSVHSLALALVAGSMLGGCALPRLPDRFEIPANDASFRTRVYAGAAMGNSYLTPNTRGTVFNVDDTDDLGTQIKLGVDVHNMLAVELETAVLGTATLREARADVNYSAASVSALIYGLNGVQLRSRREGWSTYGRLGLGIVKKSSAVVALDESGTAPIIGAGAEYGFPNGLGVRGEITRFDGDAVHLGLGAIYRFGLTPLEAGGLVARVAEPLFASTDVPVDEGGRVLRRRNRSGGAMEPTLGAASGAASGAARPWPVQTALLRGPWRPGARADDRDRDGVRDFADLCPDTPSDVTVDPLGCGLFDAILTEVVFESGSNWLTARARGELDRFAERLLVFPEARVRVLAHTDSSGPADGNLALSARRAEGVVQYLQSRGVSELQLEGRGLGETRPLASNGNPEGRRRNRRVEIETIGNLDAAALASTGERDDRDEPVRWLPPKAATVSSRKAVPATATVRKPTVRKAAVAPKTATRTAAAPAARRSLVPPMSGARPDALPDGVPDDELDDESEGVPEDEPRNAPDVASEGVPEDEPSNAPDVESEGVSEDEPSNESDNESKGVPEDEASNASEDESGSEPEDKSDNASENEPGDKSDNASADEPEVEPEVGAARLAGRPSPLPTPGFVAGLEIGGVLEEVRFVGGSAELRPSARPELERIAGELRKYPGARVAIMAHTDDRGDEADNLALSEARADSVLVRLIELGIDPGRLETEGYGESLPLMQNVTDRDRARNRRVELRILR